MMMNLINITDYEIIEWFYSHDAEWQNDCLSDADINLDEEGGREKLIAYLREHFYTEQ